MAKKRWSLSVPMDGFSMPELGEVAREAERLGYTDAWSFEVDGVDGFTPLAVIGMATGMAQYNDSLEQYKKNQADTQQQPWFQEQVASLQKQISDARAAGASSEEVQALQQQLDMLINPAMPSVLYVFGGLNESSGLSGGYFSLILMLLSIVLGFDLITREKEEGSLKSLLSHPVYRDSVINGKLLGAFAILVIVMGSVFLVTLAIMLFYGVVPTGDDLLRIAAYFVTALLYCGVFFAMATLFSTLAKTSAMSILFVLSVVVALIIVPTFAPKVADAIMGPAPVVTPIPVDIVDNKENASGGIAAISPISSKIIGWDPDVEQYYQKKQMIIDSIDTVSPMYSFDYRLSPAILYKQGGNIGPVLYKSDPVSAYQLYKEPTLLESLGYVWVTLLALMVELIVPLAISYIIFMRADVR
jgi:ABC-2 type transport system permease protein